MTNAAVWDRIPVIISFAEAKQMVETYGFAGSQGQTAARGPAAGAARQAFQTPSMSSCIRQRRCICCRCRPRSSGAGLHVLCCGSRYAKNDSPLIMEKVAYDLGRYIRHAREELGYRNVILVGWSGGGSLSLFFIRRRPNIRPSRTRRPATLTISPRRGCRARTESSSSRRI